MWLFLRYLLAFTPLYIFAVWVSVFVAPGIDRNEMLHTVILLVAGIACFSLSQWLIIRFWLLPRWAHAISETIYAGTYVPEDDPVAVLSATISRNADPTLIPNLQALAESDKRRARGWLELARALECVGHNPEAAAKQLCRGAQYMTRREDAALLLWRAYVLYGKCTPPPEERASIHRTLTSDYADTGYGALAAAHGQVQHTPTVSERKACI